MNWAGVDNIESVVIIKWPRGYVAHIRCRNPKKDIDISSKGLYLLYRLIEGYCTKMVI